MVDCGTAIIDTASLKRCLRSECLAAKLFADDVLASYQRTSSLKRYIPLVLSSILDYGREELITHM